MTADRTACRLGYEEHDGMSYCYEHGGFAMTVIRKMTCDRHPKPLPMHRTEAGYPRCATCDGGGCLDCTDPS
jgi:hypothetical protein